MADVIHLQCEDCSRINYTTFRNKKKQTNKIVKKKFCPAERRHTVHKESK